MILLERAPSRLFSVGEDNTHFRLPSDSSDMPDALTAVSQLKEMLPAVMQGAIVIYFQLVKGTYRTHAALAAFEGSSPAVVVATG